MATVLNAVASSQAQINFETVVDYTRKPTPSTWEPALKAVVEKNYNEFAFNIRVMQVGRIQAEFERFHAQNPQVYEKLVEYAYAAKANGHKRASIKLLFERVRWYATMEVKSGDTYVLNNSYTSRYARLIMQQEPALKDFFVTREVRS